MPDLRSLSRITMRGHPVLPLDSAVLLYEPGLRRNDKHKVFIRRFNIKNMPEKKQGLSFYMLFSMHEQLPHDSLRAFFILYLKGGDHFFMKFKHDRDYCRVRKELPGYVCI